MIATAHRATGGIRLIVHPGGNQHDGRTQNKSDGHVEVEQRDRSHEGDDDAETGRKSLQDVIGVFDDQSGQQTAEHLNKNSCPCPWGEVSEDVGAEPSKRTGSRRTREHDGG